MCPHLQKTESLYWLIVASLLLASGCRQPMEVMTHATVCTDRVPVEVSRWLLSKLNRLLRWPFNR